SLTGFIRAIPPTRPRETASAWPWHRRSPLCTAGASRSKAPPATAVRSPCACRRAGAEKICKKRRGALGRAPAGRRRSGGRGSLLLDVLQAVEHDGDQDDDAGEHELQVGVDAKG